MDLPTFNGEDVTGWLPMAKRYNWVQCIPPLERVSAIASHFAPHASVWMNSREQKHPQFTWEHFVLGFLEYFGSNSSSYFKAFLSHLQHATTVDHYIFAFMKLSCWALEWSDDQLLLIFYGGLKNDIRHDVMALEPLNLAVAKCLTWQYEPKLLDSRLSRSQRPPP